MPGPKRLPVSPPASAGSAPPAAAGRRVGLRMKLLAISGLLLALTALIAEIQTDTLVGRFTVEA